MASLKYKSVSQDSEANYRREVLAGKPWRFINMLPVTINVYVYRPHKLDLICTIQPQQTVKSAHSQTGMELQEEDELHVLLPSVKVTAQTDMKNIIQYEIIRPVKLFSDSRQVKIGDVVYHDKMTETTQRTHVDIPGIRIHNYLSMPIDIYVNGLLVAHAGTDDGTSYMAGSINSVYVSNDRNGFKIGDKIHFKLGLNGKSYDYCTATISDNYLSDIYVGVISQKYVKPVNDIYSYRVNQEDINGLKYYGRYKGQPGYAVPVQSAREYRLQKEYIGENNYTG
jgi:hypothetical protein